MSYESKDSLDRMEAKADYVEAVPQAKAPNDLESSGSSREEGVVETSLNEYPNIRTVGWKKAAFTMMKTQVGIGVLGIPGAFQDVGIIPGNICLLASAAVMTWSNYEIGQFKRRYPNCYGLEDAAQIMFGSWGREVFMVVFLLYWTFVTGSAYVTLSTAFNALSDHGACTAIFVAVSAVAGFMLCSVTDLKKVSLAAIPAMGCILVAVFTVTIAVALQDRPAAAPQDGPWSSDWQLVGRATFAQTMTTISTCIFAYSGTPAFFQIEAEMRVQKDYNKAMFACQAIVTTTYIIVGNIVYYYCGSYVASPALGSAGPTLKKVSYGIALPGLCVTTMIVAHIPARAIYMRIVRSKPEWQNLVKISSSMKGWTFWLSCTGAISLAAYVIASAIPGFSSLVSLIGALFGTFISILPYGPMWLFRNLPTDVVDSSEDYLGKLPLRQRWADKQLRLSSRTLKWKIMALGATLAVVGGAICLVGGTYGSAIAMKETIEAGSTGPWTCANNA